jgi:hypothetical protein
MLKDENVLFRERRDGLKVYSEDEPLRPDGLGRNLKPTAWRCADVDDAGAWTKKFVTLVYFQQLIRGAGAIALVFGSAIKSVFGLITHLTRLLIESWTKGSKVSST